MKISKTTEDRYNEMLEVLPPKAINFPQNAPRGGFNAFLVGEPNSTRDGEYTYASFFLIDGQYYEGETITEEEFKAFNLLDDGDKLEDEEDATGEIAEELDLIETLGENGAEIVKAGKYLDIPINNIEEAYVGEFNSNEEFAQEMAENTGFEQPASWPYNCIDWEFAGRELMYDYAEHNGYYFRNL